MIDCLRMWQIAIYLIACHRMAGVSDYAGRGRLVLSLQSTTVDETEFRAALRHWASGVSVVTSAYHESRHGMTVSSFISVSLAPPLLLVSLEAKTRTLDLIRQSKSFAVNILRHDQADLSDRFAGRLPEMQDRFSDLETYSLQSQSPLLKGALAGFDCQLYSLQEAGDHFLVIGKVVALHTEAAHSPLVYYQRGYHSLNAETGK